MMMSSRRLGPPVLVECVLVLAFVGGRVPNPPWLVVCDGFCGVQRSAHIRDHEPDEQSE